MNIKIKKFIPILVLKFYVLMLLVNYLANALPIAGIKTGEVSAIYSNLFTPSSFTFSIWGIIYILLFIYSVFQIVYYNKLSYDLKKQINKVGIYYIVSSLANILWIVSWHYQLIPLSLIFMIIILVSLIKINLFLRKKVMTSMEKYMIKLPFSVYLAWISIATIANITVLLVSINWTAFGISEITWTNIIILLGAVISIISMHYYKSLSYGAVILWAYFGILAQHMSMNGFDWRYPTIIGMTIFSLVILFASEFALLKNEGDR